MPANKSETTPDAINPRMLLKALRGFKRGDFTVRLPDDLIGVAGEIAQAFNDVVSLNENMNQEFARIAEMVGSEGKIKQRASLGRTAGSWSDNVNSINSLINNLIQPIIEISSIIGEVADGNLSRAMPLDVEGIPLQFFFQNHPNREFHGGTVKQLCFRGFPGCARGRD